MKIFFSKSQMLKKKMDVRIYVIIELSLHWKEIFITNKYKFKMLPKP